MLLAELQQAVLFIYSEKSVALDFNRLLRCSITGWSMENSLPVHLCTVLQITFPAPLHTHTHTHILFSSFYLLVVCSLFSLLSCLFPSSNCPPWLFAPSSFQFSLSLACLACQCKAVSRRLVSHLQEACGWDRCSLSIIYKVWQRMTLLILKDYFLIEQFVTQKVYTVYLCALWISSVVFFAPADVCMCTCWCVGVKMSNYRSNVIEWSAMC